MNTLNEDYDIIAITESWLSDDVTNNELFDKRYDVFRQDRDFKATNKKRGGGLIFAIKKSFQAAPLTHLNKRTNTTETLWVKCKIYGQDLTFCICYLPPPVSHDTLKSFVEETCELNDLTQSKIMFLGDFNIPEFGDTQYDNNDQIIELNKLINFYNLKSYNTVKNKNLRTLDLCLSNFAEYKISKNKTAEIEIEKSDGLVRPDRHHPPLLISIHLQTYTSQQTNNNDKDQKKKYNFNRANFQSISLDLEQINWYNLMETKNQKTSNEKLQIFYTEIEKLLEKHVPTFSSKNIKEKFPTWWTYETVKLYKKKERLRKIKNKSNKQKHTYQHLRKFCKQQIKNDYNNLLY